MLYIAVAITGAEILTPIKLIHSNSLTFNLSYIAIRALVVKIFITVNFN